jgi:hypothetical protein
MTARELITEMERLIEIAKEQGFNDDISVCFMWKSIGEWHGEEISSAEFEISKYDRATTADICLYGTLH